MTPETEGEFLVTQIAKRLPAHLDGRKCVRAMKRYGSNNWRQMEWPGFFFEEAARTWLDHIDTGGTGPTVANTTFDYSRDYVWDFKVHSKFDSAGRKNYVMYLNDEEATRKCIEEHGGIGFIVAHGEAVYDSDESFYEWHEELKGAPSSYQKNTDRGSSRTRKQAFDIERISAHFISSTDELKSAKEDGVIGVRGQGQNADGTPRPDKFTMKPYNLSDSYTLAESSP